MALRLWRLVTGPHPIWSGEGARLFGGRWNPPGLPVIYAGTSFALCLLENLVHSNRKNAPTGARYVEATVPDAIEPERFDVAAESGWDALDNVRRPQAFGRAWLTERRSAVLLVPSVITAGRDWNAVINPNHPDADGILVTDERPVALDRRLFGGPAA